MTMSVPGQIGGLPLFVIVVFWLMTLAVQVAFAAGVWRDASRLQRSRSGPFLAGPFWWMIATLLGGVFVAGIYWVIHHSTLRPSPHTKDEGGDRLE
jgi:hypothetical protein